MAQLWSYRSDVLTDRALVGFDVEARDGHIGKVSASTTEVDAESLVVDTGFWIFGKQRLIPVGVIERIDAEHQRLHVAMSKDEVRAAPDWHPDWWADDELRRSFGEYYSPFGW